LSPILSSLTQDRTGIVLAAHFAKLADVLNATTLTAVPHLRSPPKGRPALVTRASVLLPSRSSRWVASSGAEPDRIIPSESASADHDRPGRESCVRRLTVPCESPSTTDPKRQSRAWLGRTARTAHQSRGSPPTRRNRLHSTHDVAARPMQTKPTGSRSA